MSTIVVIEDNESLAAGLRGNLEFEGHVVHVAATAADGLPLALQPRVDLVILDLMLPDGDGYRVLRAIRDAGCDVPVLILSALGDEADKVRGFRFGADDYVTKPFGLLELIARVDALMRRTKAAAPAPSKLVAGELVIDLDERAVSRRGRPVDLRPREFELLAALIRRAGGLASRTELLAEVWGYDESVVSRTVDTHIAELRRKLEQNPARPVHILTVLKVGYRFVA